MLGDTLVAAESRYEATFNSRGAMLTSRILAGLAAIFVTAGQVLSQESDSVRVAKRAARVDHVEELFHGHGFDQTGGIHIGSPAILSAAVGVKYWLGDLVPGALYATAEPGILAFRYGAGYQIYDGRAYGAGAALRLVHLTGWRTALGMERGVQYSGGEVAVSGAFALSARAGLYAGRRGDRRRVSLLTLEAGLGF